MKLKKQCKKRYKKLRACLIAAAAALALVPAGLAAQPETKDPELYFDVGDPKSATVVTGRSVPLRRDVPFGFATEDLIVMPQGGKTPIEGGITSLFTDNASKTGGVTVDAFFDPSQDKVDETVDPKKLREEKIYTLQTEYVALRAQGTALEKNPALGGSDTGTRYSTIECNDEQAITEYSSCMLTCTRAEMEGEAPGFSLTVPVDGAGVFEQYRGAEVAVTSLSQEYGKPKEIGIVLKKGNEEMHLTLTTQLTYRYVTENMDTGADKGVPVRDNDGKTTPKDPDNYVRMGTTFELSFSMPRSNRLVLTVLTPQAAIGKVEEDIRLSDGVVDTTFVNVADGDSLDRITQDFNLRFKSYRYSNAQFQVEWEWKATHVVENGVTKEIENPDDYADVVSGGNANTEWQKMFVSPREDDVIGKLTATVSYIDTNTQRIVTVSDTLPEKTIVVRGNGIPVDVLRARSLAAEGKWGEGEPKPDIVEKTLSGSIPMRGEKINMDAFCDPIQNYTVKPAGPYQYELDLSMGAKNGAAQYARVEVSGDTNAISLQTKTSNGQPVDYKPGDDIVNPLYGQQGSASGSVRLIITAQRQTADSAQKKADLTVTFYIPDKNGTPQPSSRKFSFTVTTVDNTPSQNSALKALDIRYAEEDSIFAEKTPLEYPFSPDRTTYTGPDGMLHLPYRAQGFYMTPIREDNRGEKPIVVEAFDTERNQPIESMCFEMKSGNESPFIAFPGQEWVGRTVRFVVTVPSQDPREQYITTYVLEVTKDRASEDATLASLGLYFKDDKDLKNNLITNFDPKTLEYRVEIPYSTKELRVRAAANSSQAEGLVITPELSTSGAWGDNDRQWLDNLAQKFADETIVDKDTGALPVRFKVTSEAGTVREYTVLLRRQDPGTDATLKAMAVADSEEAALDYTPAFKPDARTYTLEIPYATRQIKLNLEPNDPNVSEIEVFSMPGGVESGDPVLSLSSGQIKPGAFTAAIDVLARNNETIQQVGYHTFKVVLHAEDPTVSEEYELRVRRAEPSTDAALKSLELSDQERAPIKTFAFHPDETSYSLKVPYETTGVAFTPTASGIGATIQILEGGMMDKIDPYYVGSGMTSKVINLADAGVPKTFSLLITAEDGITQKTYTVAVTREMPSTDARLKALSVENAEDFAPLFIASTTEYSARVTLGAPGVIITATPNHPAATVRINGNVVEGGQPSDLIELIEVTQKIDVEVTAQDGETKMVYTIEFTNENLIEKTSNADLRRLEINYGLMTPNFKPAVTEYDVAVTEKTWSVNIVPKADDPLAEVKVFAGTKEIGDYNGNYAQALQDGENPVTVQVTSPDGTVKKDYTLSIWRNEEDELKNLTPLQPEDIDYENSPNPIVVAIDEYPRVAAGVFTKLKEYPEKSIVFQGNDYSFTFRASDLTRVIPQTEIYDFRMSFVSPDADAIYSLISAQPANGDVLDKTVMMYFWYHGTLPGPATFNISLGSPYANQTLWWHYYNKERGRIDYYGALPSNAGGNISVRVDHFSTYLVTPLHRIAGSEDKSSSVSLQGGGKINPQTRAGEDLS